MENKVEVVQQMLSSINTNVTAGQMFHRLRGRYFLSEIPATEKNRNPKNVALSVIREIFAKKVDINVEIVNKIQDV